MDAERSEFLASMITILERLQQTCVNRGEPLLASVLAIAKGEAEDAQRHADELKSLNTLREKMSSQRSWRAADQLRLAADAEEAEEAAPIAEADAYETYADDGEAGEGGDIAEAMAQALAEEIAA
jgi:hypothetical protein